MKRFVRVSEIVCEYSCVYMLWSQEILSQYAHILRPIQNYVSHQTSYSYIKISGNAYKAL